MGRDVSPEHPEPFAGERFTAAATGQILSSITTVHRGSPASAWRMWAAAKAFGAALLAQVARSGIGIECCAATVRTAMRNFARCNLHFLQGDARRLSPAARRDAVVSFETIQLFRRVLRPGASFIVSTPDRDVYSPSVPRLRNDASGPAEAQLPTSSLCSNGRSGSVLLAGTEAAARP